MYKLHLILKYLRKRRIAWVSLVAVMLCTTMVLVVISVMGGWLRMFRQSFHGLSGDISITSRSLTGFARYEDMIKAIEALPEVEAAAPVIRTFGLMKINNLSPDAVQVLGYPMERIAKVNNFRESLYRMYQKPVEEEGKNPAEMPPPSFGLVPGVDYQALRPRLGERAAKYPGMIVGAGVVGIGKNKDGVVERPEGLLEALVRLEVLGIREETQSLQGASPTPNYYWIIDDSRTQIWQYDSKTVYVPFEVLQKDLDMAARIDPETKEVIDPARTTDIHIKAKPGTDLYALKPRIEEIVGGVGQYPFVKDPNSPIRVETWEEANATWLGAVEKEKGLVTFLFGMISIVAIFLIFCIFYMIVVEKTKDIGIIKSVGATSEGVAGIFLGYGAAIGIVGSGLGLLLGWLIVHYINEIHTWMGKVTGVQIWNPEVYAFDTIPNTMNPNEVTVILIVAVIASVLGALVPAIRAAQMNPVEALRWE
jgi:lipoprotein-releasing system permease protein